MATQIKITVLKRDLYKDLVDKFAADKSLKQCEKFTDGQEYILDKPNIPEGFCAWAWADLHRDIVSVYNGASLPWIGQKNAIVSCCTDGLRPVVFKIERI
jgi:uncharacterized repeat protein (TIGR04076 family)